MVTATSTIKILIVDDHAIVRRGLKDVVSAETDMAVEGEASSHQEAMQLINRREWDVVVLDIAMPGRNGLDTLRDLKQLRPKLPVLVLSMYPEDQFAVRVLRTGASGYMNKETAPEELVKAIRKVVTGGKYVSQFLAEKLATDLETAHLGAPHEQLSDREYQVLCMLASGNTITDVAEELNLSVKTVSTYRTRILEKMKLRNNAELTTYAIRNGIVP